MTPSAFFSRTAVVGDCFEWQGASSKTGYGKVRYQGKPVDTHRVSYTLTVGPIPPGMDVCHSCDNRICVRPAHLFLGTRRDNMQDAKRKGRLNTTFGNAPHHVDLTDEQVYAIAARIAAGDRQVEIAADFGVTHQTVSKIKLRQRPRYKRLLAA